MFKTQIILLVLLVIGLSIGVSMIRQSDYALYDELSTSSNPEESGSLASYSQQSREKVRKQIWYQDTSPLYFRIDSEESDLFFSRQNNQVEAVEQLSNVICVMQEELYYLLPNGKEVSALESLTQEAQPMQRVRYLKAKQASYNYTTHLFVGEDVKMWQYQLEGHTPPEVFHTLNPLMRATAHSIEFVLEGKKLDFTAHRMRAIFNHKESPL